MRLTLRTLLAYLDDLLEPADAEELGKRIEESEFATAIVSRINDCMRRLRLGAPSLSARGMGGDPNTVAEYLDNTMNADLVPEFERVCLESDMHLAEVAACHQILTLVLGEPADVDPASRRRMYELLQHPAEPVPASSEPAGRSSATRRRPTVPDYLREPDSGNRWLKIGAAAAVVLIAVVIVGSLRIGNRRIAKAPTTQVNESKQAPVGKADAKQALAKKAATTQGEPVAADESRETEHSPEDLTQTNPAEDEAMEEIDATRGMVSTGKVAGAPAVPAAKATPPAAKESEMKHDETTEPSGGTTPADAPITPEGEPTSADDKADGAETTEPPATNGAIGRYVSEGQVLLRLKPPDDWMRLPARDSVMVGDQITCLPDFRGTVALNSGVTAHLLPTTRISLQYADSTPIPEITIDFGRVMLLSSARPDAQVHVRVGAEVGILTLSDPSSVAAVEVLPVLPLGADPEKEPGTREITLFVSQGSASWQSAGAKIADSLTAPAIRTWTGKDLPASTTADLPSWVVNELALGENDRRAADYLVNKVTADRSARLSLTEIANDRRFEMKSLAVRSLGLIDGFEPLVLALNETLQRSAWAQHIELLRMSLARGPETAAKVRAAFEKRRPDNAADLYRMLAGFTEEQLRQGAAARLVANLDSPALDVRVLANWNLEQITGEVSRYRPHDPPNLRQPQLRRWKQWLQKYQPAESSRGS